MTWVVEALAGMRACVIGPNILHEYSLLAMLQQLAVPAATARDSHSFRLRSGPDSRTRTARALDLALGTRDPSYMRYVLEAIDAARADIALFYWGTLPLADIVAIRRERPKLKTVLMLLCYPLALNSIGIARQNLMLRRALPYIDGLLCPTNDMRDYLKRGVARNSRCVLGVVPPCWPASMMPVERPQPISDRPDLIYVGRTDISGATAHGADDTRVLLRSLLDAGVELHHGHSPETDDGHPLRRTFAPKANKQLVLEMAAHDASLMAYNTAACTRTERFEYTVPDRLISSAIAGVPVALPSVGYSASRHYLADYGALLEFSSAPDLYRQLGDRSRIAELKDAAWQARTNYVAERHAPALGAVMADVMGARDRSLLRRAEGA